MLTTLKDMTREDILNAIGLQTRKEPASYLAPIVGIFGTGVLIGVGVGFLMAPKAGKELRQNVTEKVTDVTDKVKRMGTDMLNSAKNFADIGGDDAQEFGGALGQGQSQGQRGQQHLQGQQGLQGQQHGQQGQQGFQGQHAQQGQQGQQDKAQAGQHGQAGQQGQGQHAQQGQDKQGQDKQAQGQQQTQGQQGATRNQQRPEATH